MAVTKEEVVEFIANMTVLELSEFIKELEEKFGVSSPRSMQIGYHPVWPLPPKPPLRWKKRPNST